MAVRFHAKVERVSGEPTPNDPASSYTDYSIPRHAAYEKRDAATKRIEAQLAARLGGTWRVTNIMSSFLSSGRGR